jgi:hypothetical protein
MPFTTEQFFEVFRTYNKSIYPGQLIILLIGIYSVFILYKKKDYVINTIGALLIMLWLWIGIIYHILFFTVINKAAYIFGGLFILQAILFFFEFRIKKRIVINPENLFRIIIGYFFIIFGLIIYPLIGLLEGKNIEYIISFGLPCPSVIFTCGILILAGKSIPKYLLIIPTLWAFIGFFAVLKFGVYQDILLPVSAVTGIVLAYKK